MNTPRVEPVPHYLRAARALALLAGVALAGCGASVGPTDGSVDDVSSASDSPNAVDAGRPDGSGCDNPGPNGAACFTSVQCSNGCGAWVCNIAPGASSGQWVQQLCGGPLPPPELAA